MTSPSYSILFSAQVIGTTNAGSPGDVLIPDATTGLYDKATATVRGTRRSTGVALSSYVAGGTVEVQQSGQLSATLSGLSTGTASWVRVSSAGTLERATVSGSDDVVGWCETDGTVHLLCGLLTAAMVNASSSFTAPTGTGFVSVTAGVLDAASIKVNLASTTYVTGALTTPNGGTGLSLGALGTNVGTFLGTNLATGYTNFAGTPTGANLASLLTTALPISKGGTNYTALASAMAALAIDWSVAPTFTKTLSAGANTITFSNQVAGMTIMVRLTGAASTVTWPTVRWPGGTVPTQTASGTDVYTFYYDGSATYGTFVQAMA